MERAILRSKVIFGLFDGATRQSFSAAKEKTAAHAHGPPRESGGLCRSIAKDEQLPVNRRLQTAIAARQPACLPARTSVLLLRCIHIISLLAARRFRLCHPSRRVPAAGSNKNSMTGGSGRERDGRCVSANLPQWLCHWGEIPYRGSITVKQLPPSGRLETATWPPQLSRTRFTSARPRPFPSWRWELSD